MNWKKVGLLALGLFVLLIFFLFSYQFLFILWYFPIFLILLFLLIFKFSKKILIIFGILFVLYFALLFIPFPTCDTYTSAVTVPEQRCTCLGLKKSEPGIGASHTECIGFPFNYRETEIQASTEQEIDMLFTHSDETLFIPIKSLVIPRNEDREFIVGVNNKENNFLKYHFETEVISSSGKIAEDYFDFFYAEEMFTLYPRERELGNVRVTAQGSPEKYMVTLKVIDHTTNKAFASQQFFITIK